MRDEVIGCDTCSAGYHLRCLAKNPQLAQYITERLHRLQLNESSQKTTEAATQKREKQKISNDSMDVTKTDSKHLLVTNTKQERNQKDITAQNTNSDEDKTKDEIKKENREDDDTQSSNKWSCPKCHFVCFEEATIQPPATKKTKFNFHRWLSNTVAPNVVETLGSDDNDDQVKELNLFSKYELLSSHVKLAGKKNTKSGDYTDSTPVQPQVFMSQLDDQDFKLCLRKLSDVRLLMDMAHSFCPSANSHY